MSVYLWTNLVMGCIGIVLNLILLASGKTTETKPGTRAVSVVVGIALTAWVAFLIFGPAK